MELVLIVCKLLLESLPERTLVQVVKKDEGIENDYEALQVHKRRQVDVLQVDQCLGRLLDLESYQAACHGDDL